MRFQQIALALAFLAFARTPAEEKPDRAAAAEAFERLTELAGVWEASLANGHKATSRYEVVAAGSVLLERYADTSQPAGNEMVTLYHLDGDRLLLTHYCMAKNQPRMRLTAFDPANGELAFDFLDATNLPDPSAGHMHRARFRLEGKRRYTTEWEYVEGGKTSFREKLDFTRVGSEK